MKIFSFGNLSERTNKEQILAKVREAVMTKDENLFKDVNMQVDTWTPFKEEDGADFTFVERFKENGGIFVYFESKENFLDAMKQYVVENQWEPLCSTSKKMHEIFKDSGIALSRDYTTKRKKTVSITDCECLIAHTGSVVVTDKCAGSRAAYSNADVLLVFASPSQIVASMKDAIHLVKEKYGSDRPSETVIISGASKSTEIDNQLVIGVQGIKQIALFLVEEE
ncbi:MAG: LUD domain-containing protein [Bacteroidales bacterium]|nr:LUD domain-containing protein [Bacteroidales bacterium]